MKTPSPGLVIRWMSFAEDGERIVSLRRQVFVEEQGYGEDFIRTPYDEGGLHLGAFEGDELVSVVSLFVFDDDPEVFARYNVPLKSGRLLQYAKRAELAPFRGTGLADFMVASLARAAFEVLRPRYSVILLQGEHTQLQKHYGKFGAEYHSKIPGPDGTELVVLIVPSHTVDIARRAYLKLRKMQEVVGAKLGLRAPSLVKFLERTGRMDLIPMTALASENLYTAPLSLRDELPRLSAQTRLLFGEQKPRIAAVEFPPPPARFLDVGCGPGVYLSMLMRGSKLQGYEGVGLDASKEMVTYARLNRPDLTWLQASVYDTKLPDQHFDVVHANFLFIHLVSPQLALREINRVLRPGGIFYVVDVNDSTFDGPPEISQLISAHHELYDGDRSVMSSLPYLAAEHGFSPMLNFSTRVRNTSTSPEPVFLKDEVLLDRIKMWGLFSFLAQREELAQYLKSAMEYYYSSSCEMSICVETQVYRKTS